MGKVLQVVGYQNSGKTTFVADYIKMAVEQGLKVGTIKHHGHPGAIDISDHKKDTGKHRQAGAYVSVVEGNGSVILTSEQASLSLVQLLSLYSQFQLDVIVVEGYKAAGYPKVVLIRSLDDIKILEDVVNVSCVISRVALPESITEEYRCFTNYFEGIKWLLTNKVGEIID
ncbi:molybdopterin-guanine dinucleotide biosynthesis protein B [uncultured Metabacillus sp.]|uniref:molybdopterin-guanine dinucleotide biosynthesis protein B n=1 Tax=uncultured Metabacillus sp. TaxID=2860135 RepID=UPI00261CB6FF|nr:molybdopterin-guanine dinucleotide biosynthesis protein B [uncultured Metabacillus sp.]